MAATFTFSLESRPSSRNLSRMYGDIVASMGDYRPLWDEMIPDMVSGIQKNFTSQGQSLGEPWPELSADYLERKLDDRFPPEMLIRTKKLLRSLAAARKIQRSKKRVSVGIRKPPYARHVNRRRQFVGVSPAMEQNLEQSILEYVDESMGDAIARFESGA